MTTIPLVAVVGNPNAGKSALFNVLTGARQKVGNYPGVTVERKSGRLSLADGRRSSWSICPAPTASMPPAPTRRSPATSSRPPEGERLPDALLIVLDATNLDNHLRFALQLIGLGLPTLVALNMVDLARRDGLSSIRARLEEELGVPVIETVAVRRRGIDEMSAAMGDLLTGPGAGPRPTAHDLIGLQRRARAIATAAVISESPVRRATHGSTVLLHPVAGPIPRGDHVRDVPGGIRMVRGADRMDRRRVPARGCASTPRCQRGFCARSWSTG